MRLAGLAIAALPFVIWQQGTRPALLIADDGALMGLMGTEGRILSKPTGGSFVAGIWLENDGAPIAQDIAAAREGLARDGRIVTAVLGDWRVTQVSGKTALADLQDCGGADVLIVNQADDMTRPCVVYDMLRLRDTGALALEQTETGDLRIDTAEARAGNRPWNGRSGPPEPAILLSRQ
jgi:competence protein ComEC